MTYDIRHFKPAMYLTILIGVSGFALATQLSGTWLLAVAAILFNGWLVYSGRYRPLPRIVANLTTLAGLSTVAFIIVQGVPTPIFVIGQYLVWLQVVKLYEQRANRDYAQLLTLSFLMLTAASISTADLFFAAIMLLYLILLLYCCLLLQLKADSEAAQQVMGTQIDQILLRPDPLYARSMRRMSALVFCFGFGAAVVTFLFFPRRLGSGFLGEQLVQPGESMTGFSDEVGFQNVARITQNSEPVAWVKLQRNGHSYQPPELLLRGATFDHYTGEVGNYSWRRTANEDNDLDLHPGAWRRTLVDSDPDAIETYQQIRLDPTNTKVIFAMGGLTSVKPPSSGRYLFNANTQTVRAADPLLRQVTYEAISNEAIIAPGGQPPEHEPSNIDPKIEAFARRPEVSGSDAQGPLAPRRVKDRPLDPLDVQIAKNIETYLRNNFSYTLDLTDAARIRGQDPMVAFLYDFKRGHCEYFAGAMALMCQSIGMPARIVIGFKSDNYNSFGDYYLVQQSHAHAWVEVLGTDGLWHTFDPTANILFGNEQEETFWQQAKSFFNYMEYAWATNVVAYDRDNFVQDLDRKIITSRAQGTQAVRKTSDWLQEQRPVISMNVFSVLLALMVLAFAVAIGWFAIERWRLRRRARRIGLEHVASNRQRELARRLAFYDDLIRVLDRHRIHRAPHLTPLEFSESLTFLPLDAFSAMQDVTDSFYQVRYGDAELDAQQNAHVSQQVNAIRAALAGQN